MPKKKYHFEFGNNNESVQDTEQDNKAASLCGTDDQC